MDPVRDTIYQLGQIERRFLGCTIRRYEAEAIVDSMRRLAATVVTCTQPEPADPLQVEQKMKELVD